jgi:hypothetical protein
MFNTKCLALAAALLLSACASAPSASSVEVMPTATWGGTPLTDELRTQAKIPARAHTPTRVTLHHAGVPFAPGQDAAAYLRRLQTWSRGVRGWVDIPYHYVIDLEGQVYEARDVMLAGDTNTGYDTSGHALVMLLGNLEDVPPTTAQVDTAARLSAQIIRRFKMLPPGSSALTQDVLASHKDVSAGTSCPGKHFYALLESGEFQKRVQGALAASN